MSLPSISISTYSLKRFQILLRSINYLIKHSKNFEEILIVVDEKNELYDKISKLLVKRNPKKIKLIINLNTKNLSGARNTALNYTKSERLIFLDDDVIPDANWATRINSNVHKKYHFVTGNISPVYHYENSINIPKHLYWLFGCSYLPFFNTNPKITKRPIGACFSVNTNIAKSVGGFNEQLSRSGNHLTGGEETEFAIKVFNQTNNYGYYDPKWKVKHIIPLERTNIRYIAKRGYYMGKMIRQLEIIFDESNETNYGLNKSSEEVHYAKFVIADILRGNMSLLEIPITFFVIFMVLIGYLRRREN